MQASAPGVPHRAGATGTPFARCGKAHRFSSERWQAHCSSGAHIQQVSGWRFAPAFCAAQSLNGWRRKRRSGSAKCGIRSNGWSAPRCAASTGSALPSVLLVCQSSGMLHPLPAVSVPARAFTRCVGSGGHSTGCALGTEPQPNHSVKRTCLRHAAYLKR